MIISVELSLYPLMDDYLSVIRTFIKNLQKVENIEVIGNGMSTQLFGEFSAVMPAVSELLEESFSQYGKQILVAKFFNDDRRPKK
jgi:uncharacterized protein YqgV (UPF0045/DUF77 family)